MLTKTKAGKLKTGGGRFAIVASEYNGHYVDAMLDAACAELDRAGAKKPLVVRVPGAYEIPIVAQRLAGRRSARFSAILCLGVIFRGETAHADHIGEAVNHALMRIQLDQGIPIVHSVHLFANEGQARVRCLGRKHNRGAEAARTALVMAEVMKGLKSR